MAQEHNDPEREHDTDFQAPSAKTFPSGNEPAPNARIFPSGGYEAPTPPAAEVVAEVAKAAAAKAVDATAAPEVDARATFESEGPAFDPVEAPVAPPAPEAIPVAPKAAASPASPLAPPTADEYDRMVARRAKTAPADDRPHPSTVPIALRPTPQGPHYPAKG